MERYSIVNADSAIVGVDSLRWELRTLERRVKEKYDFDDYYFWRIHLISAPIAALVGGIATLNWGVAFLVLIFYLYFPGMIVTAVVSAILNLFFDKSFQQYWEKARLKSKWYNRYFYVKDELARVEHQIQLEKQARLAEEQRIAAEQHTLERRMFSSTYALLDRLRPFHDGTTKELIQIHQFFSRKIRWYDKYRIYQERLYEIIERAEISISELDDHERQVSEFPERLGLSFRVFKALVAQEIITSERLLGAFEAMKDWTSPVRATRRSSINKNSGSTRPRIEATRESRPTIVQSEDSSEDYDFSRPETVQLPVVVDPPQPPKRRVLNKNLKKIPFEDYVGAAKLKMETGEIGEIIVLHYEIRRVEEETGRSGTGQVRRVSEKSDSFGYDIESFAQGATVFIEVKSTTGTFWTDFFLTANEQKVMKDLGEKYWLYRIFELSKEDGSAKLSVFRGKSEIDASFELEPTNYKMNPKQASSEGMLPFDILK